MRPNHQLLLNLINNQLFKYLRAVPFADLSLLRQRLGLLDLEVEFLQELHAAAPYLQVTEFAELVPELAVRKKINYPLVVLPEPPSDQKDSIARLAELLRGKLVALVGPSKSMFGSAQGELIESFDIVVRMNFQWPVPTELIADLGSRIDILYHCCNGDFPVDSLLTAQLRQAACVCFERNLEARKLNVFCQSNAIPTLDVTEVYESLEQELSVPSPTGLVAIEHLTNFELKELYITGVTLFRDGYVPGYQSSSTVVSPLPSSQTPGWKHAFIPQLEYLQRKCSADARIRPDPILAQMLKSF